LGACVYAQDAGGSLLGVVSVELVSESTFEEPLVLLHACR
jgi:hypothetical protein